MILRDEHPQNPNMPSGYPSTLEGYKDLSPLGPLGGMVEMFRGRDPGSGRVVIIKKIRPGSSAELQRLLLDQAALTRLRENLTHENIETIETIVAVGPGGLAMEGYVLLVMEFIEGPPLTELLQRGPLSPALAGTVGACLARALEHAHQHKILHGAVKPASVMVTSAGVPKLLDFAPVRNLLATAQTQAGALNGTLEYMSPEQLAPRLMRRPVVDARTDVFSLGVLLYVALSGQLPFTGTRREMFEKIQRGEYEPLSAIAPAVPGKLQHIVTRALKFKPEDRFQSAEELAQALESFLGPARRPYKDVLSPYIDWLHTLPDTAASPTIPPRDDQPDPSPHGEAGAAPADPPAPGAPQPAGGPQPPVEEPGQTAPGGKPSSADWKRSLTALGVVLLVTVLVTGTGILIVRELKKKPGQGDSGVPTEGALATQAPATLAPATPAPAASASAAGAPNEKGTAGAGPPKKRPAGSTRQKPAEASQVAELLRPLGEARVHAVLDLIPAQLLGDRRKPLPKKHCKPVPGRGTASREFDLQKLSLEELILVLGAPDCKVPVKRGDLYGYDIVRAHELIGHVYGYNNIDVGDVVGACEQVRFFVATNGSVSWVALLPKVASWASVQKKFGSGVCSSGTPDAVAYSCYRPVATKRAAQLALYPQAGVAVFPSDNLKDVWSYIYVAQRRG